MPDQPRTGATPELPLSIREAAAYLHLSEGAVRKRIRKGQLRADLSVTGGIPRYTVYVPEERTTTTPEPTPGAESVTGLAELVAHLDRAQAQIEKLHAENLQLAGQLGFVQGQLQQAQSRLLELEAPQAESPSPRPWWRFWRR